MLFQPINRNYHDFTIVRDKDACINCQVCVRQCSYGVHYWDEARQCVRHDNTKCIGCHRCEAFCPTQALLIQEKPSAFKPNALWRPVFIKNAYKQGDSGGVLLSGSADLALGWPKGNVDENDSQTAAGAARQSPL